MNLVELVYSSRMKASLSLPEIVEILDTARSNNIRFGVTGTLVFGANRFLQAIEGPPEVIQRLFWKLLQDPRHDHVMVIGCRPLARRRFADWSMGFYTYGADGSLSRAGMRGDCFDPESMTMDQAVALLTDMAQQLETSVA